MIDLKKLVIIGCGNMALTYYPYFKEYFNIVGFAIDSEFKTTNEYMGLPVYNLDNINANLNPETVEFVVAIGFLDMNQVREKIYKRMKKLGYRAAKLQLNAYPNKHGVTIEEGSVILESTSIHINSKIGENTFISTGVNIGHGCIIGNNVWINSGVTIAGDVIIGDNTIIGVGATIGNNIEIASHNFIGAASLIVKNTNKFDTYAIKQTEQLPIKSYDFLKISSLNRNTLRGRNDN